MISTEALWPTVNSSSIQLLGLFKDELDTSEPTIMSIHTSAMFKAAVLLSQQYNITVDQQLLGWQTAQTGGSVITALRSACSAVSNGNITGIIGPNLSREAHMIAAFAKMIGIPVISYGATDPDLSDRNMYPTFYRTVPSDNKAAKAIAQLFLQHNWTSCTIIYQNDAFGSGGLKAMDDIFYQNNLTIAQTIVFDTLTHTILGDMKEDLTNSQARIVVLWIESKYVPLILQDALDNDLLGPRFTWILSSPIQLDIFDESVNDKLIGMLTVQPTSGNAAISQVNTTLRNAAYEIWKRYERKSFPEGSNVHPYALLAFDATWSIILALQRYCSTQVHMSSCISFVNSSFCFDRRFLQSRPFLDTINSNIFLGVSGLVQFGVDVTDRLNDTYYYSQNIQSSMNGLEYVPVLVWSDTHSWLPYNSSTAIVWPGNTRTPPNSFAKLENVNLKILVVSMSPFLIISDVINAFEDNKTRYTGYFADLIDLLQSKTHFIPELILKPANLTYTESIKTVANGEYDMFIGDVTISASRREIVDFSIPIFDDALSIIVRKQPAFTVELLSFLKPFTRNLWLTILAAGVYSAILIYLYEREENNALKDKSKTSSVTMSGWYSFGTLMGYGVDFEVSTAAGRLLTSSLYILSLILVATYTANLASNLTIRKSQNVISGIDDIKNGKIPHHRIGIRPNTTTETFFLREISNGHRSYYPLIHRQHLIDSLLSGVIDAAFIGSALGEYVVKNLYCNLTLVGARFGFSSYGIVTPKYWVYGNELDVNIISLQELGILDQLKLKWFSRDTCPVSSNLSTSIGVDELAGLFLIFAVISILSWFLFIWKKRFAINKYVENLTCQKALCVRKPVFPLERFAPKRSKHSKRTQITSSA